MKTPHTPLQHRNSSPYTWVDVMMADPIHPLPQDKRDYQLKIMHAALDGIEQDPHPTVLHWKVVSDAVNLMDTWIKAKVCEDTEGLLKSAKRAMGEAGARHLQGKSLRLDGPGILAVRAVLRDYETMLGAISARQVILCHIKTAKRIREIHQGKTQPGDVVVAL